MGPHTSDPRTCGGGGEGSPQYKAQSSHPRFPLPPGHEGDMEKVSPTLTVPSFPPPAAHPSPITGPASVPTQTGLLGALPLPAPGVPCGRRGGSRGQRLAPGFLTFLPPLSRLDAPTPKSSPSEDELPEDYPVVRNMLHRLAGKGGGGGLMSAPSVSEIAKPSGLCLCLCPRDGGTASHKGLSPAAYLTVLAAGPAEG